jgi:L,D-transpeptidase ErfK/SrfK
MKIIITIIILLIAAPSYGEQYYSTKLCESGQYDCLQVKPGDTWTYLFPDPEQRDLVKRFNRMNTRLKIGMYIAIPEEIDDATVMSTSPFPYTIAPQGSKVIIVDLTLLAWGAYDIDGNLVRWGPASGGKPWCYDIKAPGKTVIGQFQIYDVRGKDCISTKFPVDSGGGAPMPYCMFFQGGYALHGSDEVPGYNASHGCVRLFKEDAQWLNEEFVKQSGRTKVLVLPY